MDHLVIGTGLSFVITFLAIPIIIRVAQMKKLYDLPDDDRKVHLQPIPSLGGIGIFAGLIIAWLLAAPEGTPYLQYIIAALMVVFFLGLKDDIVVLTPLKKFIGQLVAAGILVFKGDIMITGMHGFLGIEQMPYFVSLLFTFLTIVVITNSFNLIDGVDGLAASLGAFSSLAFGVYFLLSNQPEHASLAFSMLGALIAFLIFNTSPARIFMGDTGSLLLGIVNAILVIRFIESSAATGAIVSFEAAPAIGFAILFVPLFDTLRIFAFRILSRRSPFSPDRNHVHHLLLDKGCSHKQVVLCAVGFNVAIAALTYALRHLNNTLLLLGLVTIGFISISILIYTSRGKRKALYEKAFNRNGNTSETKIIPLSKEALSTEKGELAR